MEERERECGGIIFVQGKANQLPDNDFNGKLNIRIKGNENIILIDPSVVIDEELNIFIEGSRNCVLIGENTTIVQMTISMAEDGHKISIGKDCMISSCVELLTSDFHSIIDKETGIRVNPGADIIVEDHVWICRHTQLLKGSVVHEGAVVAAGALVSGVIPSGVVSNGRKVLRSEISWDRELRKIPWAAPVQIDGDTYIDTPSDLQCNIELVKPLKVSGKDCTYCKGWALCAPGEKVLLKCTPPEGVFVAKQYYRQDIVDYFGLETEPDTGWEILLPIAIRDLRQVSILVGAEEKYSQREITHFFIQDEILPV